MSASPPRANASSGTPRGGPWRTATGRRPSPARSPGSGGRASSGSTTSRSRAKPWRWRAPPRTTHRELRSVSVSRPAALAGRRRDPARRVRHLPLPPLPRGDAGDADRRRADDPLGELLRGGAREVHDDQLPARIHLHLRRVPPGRGVPAPAAQRPPPARPIPLDAPLLAERPPVGGRGDRGGDGPAVGARAPARP